MNRKVSFVIHNKMALDADFRQFVENESYVESSEEFHILYPGRQRSLTTEIAAFEELVESELREILDKAPFSDWCAAIDYVDASVWPSWDGEISIDAPPVKISHKNRQLSFGSITFPVERLSISGGYADALRMLADFYLVILSMRVPSSLGIDRECVLKLMERSCAKEALAVLNGTVWKYKTRFIENFDLR